MVKPLGIVTMLILLVVSGPTLADNRELFTRHIDVWGVTSSGNLYLETKRGEKYKIPISHCPYVRSQRDYQYTPIELVHSFEEASISFTDRKISDNGKITFFDRKSGEKIACRLGKPDEMVAVL